MARQAGARAAAEEERLALAVRQIQVLAESDVPGVAETWRGVAMMEADARRAIVEWAGGTTHVLERLTATATLVWAYRSSPSGPIGVRGELWRDHDNRHVRTSHRMGR